MDISHYSAMIFLSCLSSLVMMHLIAGSTRLSPDKKTGFILTFLLLLIAAVAEWLGVYLNGSAGALRLLHLAAKALELSVAPLIALTLTWTFNGPRAAFPLVPLCAVNLLLEIVSLFTGAVYYLDQDNLYQHGPLYWFYIVCYLVCIGLFIFQCARFSRAYQNRNLPSLVAILLFVLCGISIHALYPSVRADWLCLTIAASQQYIYYTSLVEQLDSPTGLLDRKSYDIRIRSIRRHAIILQCDIDHFKEINDTYGHDVGDQCLAVLGSLLKQVYSRNGLCYRTGGDEFCVILTRFSVDIQTLNQRFYSCLHQAQTDHAELPLPNVSLGYAFFDPASGSIQDAVRQADATMYRNKRANR